MIYYLLGELRKMSKTLSDIKFRYFHIIAILGRIKT